MKLLLSIMVFAFLCNSVFADSAYVDRNTNFSFPTSIASYTFSDKREYGDARLGYGLNYRSNDGDLITVIVYNLGIGNIQNGIDGSSVVSQYRQAQDDVIQAVKDGHYKSATEIPSLPSFSSSFLKISYNIMRKNGSSTRSHLFLRGQEGYFLKVRATGSSAENFDEKVVKFLEQLLIIVSSNKRLN